MALKNLNNGIRLLLAGSLVAGVGFALPVVAGADPTSAAATRQKLDVLAVQSSQLTEKYDQAQTIVAAKQAAANLAQQQAQQAAAAFQAARARLSEVVVAQYESPAFSSTGALLTSDSGQQYLDTVSNLTLISTNRGDVVVQFDGAAKASAAATKAAAAALAAATKTRDALNAQRTTLAQSIAKYQGLLATLTAAEQRTYRNTNTVADTAVAVKAAVPVTVPAPTAAAGKAVAFALAQVGKPYVFGASGPGAYDCSGLTSAAYAAAGISLPHSAEGQYSYGTHVSFGQLEPGDLIFLYQPIGHVEIYIGGGLAVSAPTSGENVKVITVSAGDGYTGATRLT
ncbi:Cell wall-associated hydrolase, NlpC family [Frankineae bacterium MT45]|nr:Cell wall-associated hydrolase, NlpC family [Frankineae bacterium MT45]